MHACAGQLHVRLGEIPPVTMPFTTSNIATGHGLSTFRYTTDCASIAIRRDTPGRPRHRLDRVVEDRFRLTRHSAAGYYCNRFPASSVILPQSGLSDRSSPRELPHASWHSNLI